jgi:hypothetical protein
LANPVASPQFPPPPKVPCHSVRQPLKWPTLSIIRI